LHPFVTATDLDHRALWCPASFLALAEQHQSGRAWLAYVRRVSVACETRADGIWCRIPISELDDILEDATTLRFLEPRPHSDCPRFYKYSLDGFSSGTYFNTAYAD